MTVTALRAAVNRASTCYWGFHIWLENGATSPEVTWSYVYKARIKAMLSGYPKGAEVDVVVHEQDGKLYIRPV